MKFRDACKGSLRFRPCCNYASMNSYVEGTSFDVCFYATLLKGSNFYPTADLNVALNPSV